MREMEYGNKTQTHEKKKKSNKRFSRVLHIKWLRNT